MRRNLLVAVAAVVGSLVCLHAGTATSFAGAKSFPSVSERGGVLTFKLRGLKDARVKSAKVVGHRKVLRVSARRVERATRRGVLRVKAPRSWRVAASSRARRVGARAAHHGKGSHKLRVVTDTTPPETTISSGSSGTVSSTSASFGFSSSESGSTFECRLDGATWAACSSPKAYSGLAEASHTFEVRATDAAGNLDASPASRDFTVAGASTSPPPPPPPTSTPPPPTSSSSPPPAGGYLATVPPGQLDYTMSDAEAAAKVQRSSWEPRPQNHMANHTVPPADFAKPNDGWGTNWDKTYGRVTGNFTGTTDEIIQWGAAKWGISDEVLRAILMNESSWYQNLKTADGTPIHGKGYGDYGHCPSSQVGSPYGDAGPGSFGITQVKWCSFNRTDAGNPPNAGGYPWIERSTAYAVDMWGATVRRCFEGWNWMGDEPRGDIWGCVGRWYSGDYNPNQEYVVSAKQHYANKPWRQAGF